MKTFNDLTLVNNTDVTTPRASIENEAHISVSGNTHF